MSEEVFHECVLYGQVGVCKGGSEYVEFETEWSEADARCGFSWSSSAVWFLTILDGGSTRFIWSVGPRLPDANALRIIRVPLIVGLEASVAITLIGMEPKQIAVPPGSYALTFEHASAEPRTRAEEMWCKFTFEPTIAPVRPVVLRADSLLFPPPELLVDDMKKSS